MDAPVGPFGTKEAPAVIQSYYDKRIVGCPGGGGGKSISSSWPWHSKVILACVGLLPCYYLSLSDNKTTSYLGLQRMSTMLYGSGWRKANRTNAQSALNTLW
ncbi:hypothetical protein B296_00020548 [Ensete ventricosum]|uniref:Uncharacterized protein n=1 Tax=Ensete ventricosum TaxID=4639 RepID=A0A426YWJ8_ENSVE|nr:hypothetical protein B296_00020548 [Ensete ventricosum]